MGLQVGLKLIPTETETQSLSAPHGVDAMFFVMRSGRITDDTIARQIPGAVEFWVGLGLTPFLDPKGLQFNPKPLNPNP